MITACPSDPSARAESTRDVLDVLARSVAKTGLRGPEPQSQLRASEVTTEARRELLTEKMLGATSPRI